MPGAAKVTGTVRSKNPLKGAVEILPERLYYAALSKLPPSHNILASIPKRKQKGETTAEKGPKKQIHFFCIDNELVYWNFFLDFGPLNSGQLVRFCKKLNDKLRKFPAVCFYSNTVPAKRANAIFLICAWQMLYLDRTPEEAYAGFERHNSLQNATSAKEYSLPPVSHSQGAPTIADLPPFHDASPCQCTYDLTVFDCLLGLRKALEHNFFDLETFDVEEYEYFEQVENGDLNWIVPDKILAFAGPSYERHVSPEGYCTLAPSDYIPYFKQKNVGLVVRLNKKMYHEQDFVDAGIDHIEAFFLDGSCPSMEILQGVVKAFEEVPEGKAFAVHCKAGLGRTGTCIGAYLMKHYGFTAKEVIAWMRICRPGCVIGPQQHYLEKIERLMWEQGAAEGYIELPSDESGHPTIHKEKIVHDTAMSDAVIGREGQADGLRAARSRRPGGENTKAPSPKGSEKEKIQVTSNMPSTPITPDVKEKTPVTVTPDSVSPGSDPAALWCG